MFDTIQYFGVDNKTSKKKLYNFKKGCEYIYLVLIDYD